MLHCMNSSDAAVRKRCCECLSGVVAFGVQTPNIIRNIDFTEISIQLLDPVIRPYNKFPVSLTLPRTPCAQEQLHS